MIIENGMNPDEYGKVVQRVPIKSILQWGHTSRTDDRLPGSALFDTSPGIGSFHRVFVSSHTCNPFNEKVSR